MKGFSININDPSVPLRRHWELCVGSCHAATALREDYRRQLEQCHRELGFKYVRFHGLFDDDMSVLSSGGMLQMREGGAMVLSFTNVDSIFDFLLSIGMRPFVELGFMPRALTSGNCSIFHYNGLTSPPDDYGKWQWFIEQFAAHCVERYGLDEVRQWFFEVWNEPNLGGPKAPMGFWGGSMQEYFKLYAYAAKGIKAVDSRLKVGGPATSDSAWIVEFREYCKQNGVPYDFITTHNYPTDAVTGYKHGESKMNLAIDPATLTEEQRTRLIENMIHSRDDLWKRVPRGVFTEYCREARAEAGDTPLYYTEWNSNAGIESDGPFGSSFIAKTCMDNHGLIDGSSYWTFSDIFEEGGMPHTPFHGGYGLMTLQGVPKAAYRAFELLHKLGGELYEAKYSEGTLDIYAVGKPESGCVQFLVVNHQSLLHEIEAEAVTVTLAGLQGFVKATVERVDGQHGNALRRWRELGSPDYPGKGIIYDLLSASCTEAEDIDCDFMGGEAKLTVNVPEQGIALVTVYY